ncbi:MAG: hypothetical protein WCH34_13035 [Bacteroidota bacterium]
MNSSIWIGSRDLFKLPMLESVENALAISTFTDIKLFDNKGIAPGILALYNEHHPKQLTLLNSMGIKESIGNIKYGDTKDVEKSYGKMSENLNSADDLIRPVFGINTSEYLKIWGHNRNRFYRGSYELREIALGGMITVMETYSGLDDAIALISGYRDELKALRTSQISSIGTYTTDGIDVKNAVAALILQQNRNLGWIRYYYSLQPNAQQMIESYFDLSKIVNHSHERIYVAHVPEGGYIKLFRHHFKSTDRLLITVDGPEDAYLCLATNSKTVCKTTPYRCISGTTVNKLATEVFNSLTENCVMVTNTSYINATHISVKLIEA